MTVLRMCVAIAFLSCLVGFSWPVDESTGESTGGVDAAETLGSGNVEDRVVQLEQLTRHEAISDATLQQVRELLFSPVEALRAAAVPVLRVHGRQSDEQLLIRLLSDSSNDVRIAAVETLAAFGSRATAVALAGQLDETSSDVRVAALKTLAILAQPSATFPVLDLLLSHDPRIEIEAIRTLGQIGDPRAVPALAVRLESSDYETARAAADSLARIDTVNAVRAVLIYAAGLRPQLMGNNEMGHALKLASPSTIVDAIVAMGGNDTLEQVLTQITLPADAIRLLYEELSNRVSFDVLSQRLKFEAMLYGVQDERLTTEVFSDRSSHGALITPQEGETLDDSCVPERLRNGFVAWGSQDYRDPNAALHDQLIALRWIFMVCGEERTGRVVGELPRTLAAEMVRELNPEDPLREWLLREGADWGERSDDQEPTWTYFEALRDARPGDLIERTTVRFSENALGAILAFGWGTTSFADYLGLLSNEARRFVPSAWSAYAHNDGVGEGEAAGEEGRAGTHGDLLASLQVVVSECSALSDASESAVERAGSWWARNLLDLHAILCVEASTPAVREAALSRRVVPVSADDAIEYSPGADARATAATLWHAAVTGELTAEDVSRCVRYALGESPESVRAACLLAAERLGATTAMPDAPAQADAPAERVSERQYPAEQASARQFDYAQLLDNLRRRAASPVAREIPEGDAEHTIVVSDRATGRGVWGAPLLLFLDDGTTLKTTAGAFGFLAVPSATVEGVSPL